MEKHLSNKWYDSSAEEFCSVVNQRNKCLNDFECEIELFLSVKAIR